MLLLFEFSSTNLASSLKDIETALKKTSLKEWIRPDTTFRVSCTRKGTHDFSSQELAKEAGAIIGNLTKMHAKMENPGITFHAFASEDKGYMGIEFSGIDLSKREYNIFSHPSAINPTLAYALVRMSGYDGKKAFLDALAKSGLIPIEAALFATDFAVNHYRKDKFAFRTLLPFTDFDFESFFSALDKKKGKNGKIYCVDSLISGVRSSEKNAKIAGMNKALIFSRMDVSWLDTKFKKHQITYAVSSFSIPAGEDNEKLSKEYFYQMEYILEKKGTIVLLARSTELLEKYALEYKFKLISKKEIVRGSEKHNVLIFGKQ